jgi:hypothetical protein
MPPDQSKTSAAENSLGRANLVALAGLDSPEREEMLARILAKIEEEELEVIRIAIVDTHGNRPGATGRSATLFSGDT